MMDREMSDKPKKGLPRSNGWKVAGLSWLAMTLGLFFATLAGKSAREAGANDTAVSIIQAVVVTLIVVSAVLWIGRKYRISTGLLPTLSGRGIMHLLAGAVLVVGLGTMGFIVASYAGMITIVSWHLSTELVVAIAVNTCIALFYEALPEELSLRGAMYSGLRQQLPAAAAYVVQILLFVLVPVAANGIQGLAGMPFGVTISVDYIILLLAFGTTLQLLRSYTGSIGASIGFHLAYLEMARFVVGQREQRLLTFAEHEAGVGEIFILFLSIIVGGAMVLGALLIVRRRRRGNRAASM
ncbi:CPBP family glutamic-type intramembrane protease [Paenibacillus daejeonensis]|uniref:CPBP family glutamic-type intramembrane protease n=1 Tax=Paenibacillus daejeonensis TaxID=135193 RepID=UPI000370257A|nr:CPBP family glutamic-type intramembrane protease [Paenibacillus daejeonensis]